MSRTVVAAAAIVTWRFRRHWRCLHVATVQVPIAEEWWRVREGPPKLIIFDAPLTILPVLTQHPDHLLQLCICRTLLAAKLQSPAQVLDLKRAVAVQVHHLPSCGQLILGKWPRLQAGDRKGLRIQVLGRGSRVHSGQRLALTPTSHCELSPTMVFSVAVVVVAQRESHGAAVTTSCRRHERQGQHWQLCQHYPHGARGRWRRREQGQGRWRRKRQLRGGRRWHNRNIRQCWCHATRLPGMRRWRS
mmetsp:Transcript_80841/g.262119  ORF Transcript_80841/g.262119 Transcript_80841/m.262119 type:complete len:246 (-) Transcript_80841:188-925(-)